MITSREENAVRTSSFQPRERPLLTDLGVDLQGFEIRLRIVDRLGVPEMTVQRVGELPQGLDLVVTEGGYPRIDVSCRYPAVVFVDEFDARWGSGTLVVIDDER